MQLWKLPQTQHEIDWVNRPGKFDDVVVKFKLMTWVLPEHVARHALKFNPRHLPVVQPLDREMTDEAYYLYLSIRRIICGYRAS